MKDKNYWLIQWRIENERIRVFTEVVSVANVVRRVVMHGDQRLFDVFDSVEYNHDGMKALIEFALRFAHGYSKEEIADAMQLSESTIKVISDNSALRW